MQTQGHNIDDAGLVQRGTRWRKVAGFGLLGLTGLGLLGGPAGAQTAPELAPEATPEASVNVPVENDGPFALSSLNGDLLNGRLEWFHNNAGPFSSQNVFFSTLMGRVTGELRPESAGCAFVKVDWTTVASDGTQSVITTSTGAGGSSNRACAIEGESKAVNMPSPSFKNMVKACVKLFVASDTTSGGVEKASSCHNLGTGNPAELDSDAMAARTATGATVFSGTATWSHRIIGSVNGTLSWSDSLSTTATRARAVARYTMSDGSSVELVSPEIDRGVNTRVSFASPQPSGNDALKVQVVVQFATRTGSFVDGPSTTVQKIGDLP